MRPAGAENTARQLERAIRFRTPNAARPPVIRTSATDATGIDALLDAVKGTVRADGQRLRTRRELLHAVEAEFSRRLRQIPLDEECAAVRAGRRQIYEIVTELLAPLNCPLSGESPDRSDA